MDNSDVRAMIGSGSVSTSIRKTKTLSLADPSHKAKIICEVVVNIEVNGCQHTGMVVEVSDNLFIDLIVGKDILKKHSKVILKFNGPQKELVVDAMPDESLPAMNVSPPPLFAHLSEDIKPVATKSRRRTPADLKFLKGEVAKLHRCGLIRPSVSPWRAQPLVTSNEYHKRRMTTVILYISLRNWTHIQCQMSLK